MYEYLLCYHCFIDQFSNVVDELRLGSLQTLFYLTLLKMFAEHCSFRSQIYLTILNSCINITVFDRPRQLNM